MIWFTADTHFNHRNIIEYSSRPFASVEEMHEAMVSHWNDRVSDGDTVYHLGDFAITYGRKDKDIVDGLLSRLKGRKWLIIGNHDRREVRRSPGWDMIKHYHELKVDLGGVHKQRIVLCHYALRVWNQQHRSAWMLHGHSHGNLSDVGGKTMDVGVDCHDYCPISIDEVKQYMDEREIVGFDHHVPEKKEAQL